MAIHFARTTILKATGDPDGLDIFTSDALLTGTADLLTGFIKTDKAGTLLVQHSMDAINWDYEDSISVTANTGAKIKVDLLSAFVRLKLSNTAGTDQTFCRLTARASSAGAR